MLAQREGLLEQPARPPGLDVQLGDVDERAREVRVVGGQQPLAQLVGLEIQRARRVEALTRVGSPSSVGGALTLAPSVRP